MLKCLKLWFEPLFLTYTLRIKICCAKQGTRSKSTRIKNPPNQNQVREPLTDQGLGVTVKGKNK